MSERNDDFLSIDEVAMTAHTTVFTVMLQGNKDGKHGWFGMDIHVDRANVHLANYKCGHEEDGVEHLQHALTRIAMELCRRKVKRNVSED